MAKYPEHEKLKAIQPHSQVMGEFLDWLSHAKKYRIMRWIERGPIGERYIPADSPTYKEFGVPTGMMPNPDYEHGFSDWFGIDQSIPELLAEFFEIDLTKIDDEKRAMLDSIRAMNEEVPSE